MTLDGSELTPMTNGTVVQPRAVYADFTTKTVYWVDNYLEHVQALDYGKKGKRRHIASGNILKSVKSIHAFESKLYSASFLEKVITMEKYPSKEQHPTIRDDRGDFYKLEKMYIFHRQMQPDGEFVCVLLGNCLSKKVLADHPCTVNNGDCEHFCISATSDGKPKKQCKCAEGFIPVDNAQKCSSDFNQSHPLLIFGRIRPGEIASIHLPSLDELPVKKASGMPPVFGLRRQTSMAVDSTAKIIYFCDSNNYTIERRGIFGGERQTLLDHGVNNCEGMAFDRPSGNLYFTDQGLSRISVVNVERPQIKSVLISTNLSNPRGIAVHSEKGYIFWTDWTDTNRANQTTSKIEKAKLDGSGRTTLVDSHIQWPNGLVIDFEQGWLYWCDAYYLTIERIRFTGAERKTILQGDAVNNPYGIAIYKSFIFWTEFRTFKLKMAEIDSQGEIKMAPKQVYEDDVPLYELHVYDPDAGKLENVNEICAPKNNFGNCEQFCFPVDCREKKECEKKVCGCGQGFSVGILGNATLQTDKFAFRLIQVTLPNVSKTKPPPKLNIVELCNLNGRRKLLKLFVLPKILF